MTEVKTLIGVALLMIVAGCGQTWNSAERTDSHQPWRSNPHDLTIAVQELQRLPSPPYSKVSLNEAEGYVRPMGPVTSETCAGVQVLQLIRTGQDEGDATVDRQNVAIWEYEVRRAGGNRLSYVQRLRDRTDIPFGEDLDQEIASCQDKLVEHYTGAGASLVSLDEHPMARAINGAGSGAN